MNVAPIFNHSFWINPTTFGCPTDPSGDLTGPYGNPTSDLEFVKKFTRPNFRAKEFYTLKTPKLRLLYKLAKYVRNCVVFWKNLHSWQNFYTTAGRDGRDGRDKFQVCVRKDITTSLLF